jgi:hypothetical protein
MSEDHPTCTRTARELRGETHLLYVPEIGPSSNKFYGRMHHHKRSKLATKWKWIVRSALSKQPFTRPSEGHFPLRVCVRAHFPDRQYWYDSGNIGATEKLIVDGLRDADVLPDDDPRHVFSTTLETWLHDGSAGPDRFTLLFFQSI